MNETSTRCGAVCPICHAGMTYYFSKSAPAWDLPRINYERCSGCGFCAARTLYEMDKESWERLNEQFHRQINASPGDPWDRKGRIKNQAVMLDNLTRWGWLREPARWLDWGAGEGDLAQAVATHGRRLFCYDPYITPLIHPVGDRDLIPGSFDVVMATAVFEHLRSRRDLDRIHALVSDDGILGIHLHVPDAIPRDPKWFYLLPVHCSFFTNDAMDLLMRQWGYECSLYHPPAKAWFLFRKEPPDMAERIKAVNAGQDPPPLLCRRGFVPYFH